MYCTITGSVRNGFLRRCPSILRVLSILMICRCSLAEVIMEMDRILRPEGMVVVHDSIAFIERVSKVAKAVRWIVEVFNTEAGSAGKTRFLVARKQLLNQKSPQ